MTILLTGATGFIGTHFLRAAEATSHDVVALRRISEGRPALPPIREPRWITLPLQQIEVAQLAGVEVLVHFASAGVSPKRADWTELLEINVLATLRLARVAAQAGVRRIILAGSCTEYGRSADRFDPIPPDAPLEPTTAYGASKAAAFAALFGFAVEQGLELGYLRVFSAFGEGQFERNFWPALRHAARTGMDFPMTPGEQVRDYLPVEDVAATFWRVALHSTISPGRPLVANVGSGRPITMRAFAEEWWTRFGATGHLRVGALPYRPNEVMRFVPLVTPL